LPLSSLPLIDIRASPNDSLGTNLCGFSYRKDESDVIRKGQL
jgi:hypothetical protein